MLDDLKYINDKDPADTLGIAERQWQQLTYKFDIDLTVSDIKNIVVGGMGGSALAGLLSQTWPGYDIPFEVSRSYDVPNYVGPNSLFIASSYSGNTEETLSAIERAAEKGAQICVMAAGGKLIEVAKDKNYPYIILPEVAQPRYSPLYGLNAIITILGKAGVIDEPKFRAELSDAAEFLKTKVAQWIPTVPTASNFAKQIANEAAGKSVVIYAGPKLAPVAYKWKISFNENAKQIAWWNQYSEFNHNEFLGWTEQPVLKPYCVIDLRSNLEHPRIQRRFEVSAKMLSGKRPEPIIVQTEGDSILKQMLYAVVLGDFTSLYTAILSGLNPEPVDLIEKFKKELG